MWYKIEFQSAINIYSSYFKIWFGQTGFLSSVFLSFSTFLLLSRALGPHVFGFVNLVRFLLRQKHGHVLETDLIFGIFKRRYVFPREVWFAGVVLMRSRQFVNASVGTLKENYNSLSRCTEKNQTKTREPGVGQFVLCLFSFNCYYPRVRFCDEPDHLVNLWPSAFRSAVICGVDFSVVSASCSSKERFYSGQTGSFGRHPCRWKVDIAVWLSWLACLALASSEPDPCQRLDIPPESGHRRSTCTLALRVPFPCICRNRYDVVNSLYDMIKGHCCHVSWLQFSGYWIL